MLSPFVSGFECYQAGVVDLVLPGVLHVEALTLLYIIPYYYYILIFYVPKYLFNPIA